MAKAKKNGTTPANTNDTSSAPKKRGPRQTELPGTERKKIAAVESAFEEWDDIRAKRQLLKSSEDAHYDAIITAMQKAGVSTYKFPSQDGTTVTVSISDETKLKVHKAKPDAFNDEAA